MSSDSKKLTAKQFNVLIGRKMKMLRIAADLKQLDVAFELNYESSGMISLIERGVCGMAIDKIVEAANFFEIDVNFLMSKKTMTDDEMEFTMNFYKFLNKGPNSKHYDTVKFLLKDAIKD